ncbi:hypothetical protein Tco_0158959 [Tanacetum coccineum]
MRTVLRSSSTDYQRNLETLTISDSSEFTGDTTCNALARFADCFLLLEDDPTSSEVDPTYQDPEGDILLLEAILNSEPPPPSQIMNNICLELGKSLNSVKLKLLNLPLINLPG